MLTTRQNYSLTITLLMTIYAAMPITLSNPITSSVLPVGRMFQAILAWKRLSQPQQTAQYMVHHLHRLHGVYSFLLLGRTM